MYIEERIAQLEEITKQLIDRVEELEKRQKAEEYVTPKQLAEKMGCSKNTIYVKIRSGEIKAVKIGNAPKIPMSQFEIKNEKNTLSTRSRNNPSKIDNELEIIKEKIFGTTKHV